MKVPERVLDAEGNLDGEKIGMTIDDAAMQHIMSVLTDLYSDPELAVIREYSTNALDSHIAAGESRPIEVTLPSPLSPFFKVRDYGVGLDADDIREIYSRYGSSTKRDSNDVVGMLGLGCKSALTYSDQFTLTGIKNGRMVQVSIGRDEDGGGSMTIVSDGPTTQEDGAEVTVPAKRHNAFDSKAFDFFKFWNEGTVLINGEQPKRIGTADGDIWLEDGRLLLTTNHQACVVVMGNVPYPIPADTPEMQSNIGRNRSDRFQFGNYSRRYNTVAFVKIGDVQFTPSREALQMTKLTKETLDLLHGEIETKLTKSLLESVRNATDPHQALQLYRDACYIGLKEQAQYQGRIVPANLSRSDGTIQLAPEDSKRSFLLASYTGYTRVNGERTWTVDPLRVANGCVFTDFDGKELSPHKREKLQLFFKGKGQDVPTTGLVFVDFLSNEEKFWLHTTKVYSWDDVAAIKVPKDASITLASGKPKGSYIAHYDGRWKDILAADIDTSKPLLWAYGNKYCVDSDPAMKRELVPNDATVIAMPQNRVEKFKRDFPMAIRLDDYAKEAANAWRKKVPADELAAAKLQMQGNRLLGSLNPDKVDDPDVRKGARLARLSVPTVKKRLSNWAYYLDDTGPEVMADPLHKYPLIEARYNTYTGTTLDHVYIYLNAAYAAERKGQ